MRPSHVATALGVFTAGLTVSAALRRRSDRGGPAAPVATTPHRARPPRLLDRDPVVLPFARSTAPSPVDERPTVAARCGDSGGRTKAGTPCAARASASGRCHHHPMAA